MNLMLYRVKQGLISQTVDGELLILNKEEKEIHQFNQVASFIWNNLVDMVPIEQLVIAITEKYTVEHDVAKHDLKCLLQELSDRKLIE